MEPEANIDEMYRLLSDIWGMVAKYGIEVLKAAFNHVQSNSKGLDRDALSNILSELHRLKTRAILPTSNKHRPKEGGEQADASLSRAGRILAKAGKFNEPVVRELKAMLEDTEFIRTKQDLLRVMEIFFEGKISVRRDNKDSRQDLTSKLITAFSQMSDAEKQNVYSTLRRDYLKDRKSDLRNWAEIIASGKGQDES